jgi:hypothetical protein
VFASSLKNNKKPTNSHSAQQKKTENKTNAQKKAGRRAAVVCEFKSPR